MIKLGMIDPRTQRALGLMIGLTTSDLLRLASGHSTIALDGAEDRSMGIGDLKIWIVGGASDDELIEIVQKWAKSRGRADVEVIDRRAEAKKDGG